MTQIQNIITISGTFKDNLNISVFGLSSKFLPKTTVTAGCTYNCVVGGTGENYASGLATLGSDGIFHLQQTDYPPHNTKDFTCCFTYEI